MNKVFITTIAMVVLGILLVAGASAYRGDSTTTGPNYNEATHEALQGAIEAGNYQAWKTIREEAGLQTQGRMFNTINEENFAIYQELHNANMAGDQEAAQAIRASLGLGLGKGQGRQGMGQGNYQANFVDEDGDGLCDSYPQNQGSQGYQGKGMGRNR